MCSVCYAVCYVTLRFILCIVHCGTGAAVLAVKLSDLGVGTTLWGGVRSIYSSWGMSKCDHCGTEFTHIYTALRSTWSDSVTIFTVGCKGWYAISHPPNSLQHPPPNTGQNQSKFPNPESAHGIKMLDVACCGVKKNFCWISGPYDQESERNYCLTWNHFNVSFCLLLTYVKVAEDLKHLCFYHRQVI